MRACAAVIAVGSVALERACVDEIIAGQTSHGVPVALAVLLQRLTFFLETVCLVRQCGGTHSGHAHSVFGLLISEFPVDGPLDLTGLLHQLDEIAVLVCQASSRR